MVKNADDADEKTHLPAGQAGMGADNLSCKISRRKFLEFAGYGTFGAFLLGSGISFLKFFFPNVLYEPSLKFKAGSPDEYAQGTVSTKWIKSQRAWIVRTDKGIYALWARCTHLGCTPGWFEAE